MVSSQDILTEVNGLADLRELNKQIRSEIRQARTREQLTELKRRSDELVSLTLSAQWREKFGRKTRRFLQVAKEENVRTTRIANSTARRRSLDVRYTPWSAG
jgi:hypothetical protein